LTAKGTILTLVLAQAGSVPDCGQLPSEVSVISEDKDEPTAESMEESTSAEGSELQGMVDSYAVAHEKIEEEGGEKETSPYHVGYIVEPVEGWWEGDPEVQSDATLPRRDTLPRDTALRPRERALDPRDGGKTNGRGRCRRRGRQPAREAVPRRVLPLRPQLQRTGGGTYTPRAKPQPPDFNRHGDEDGGGSVFTEAVTVMFENVEITSE
jgi:hypothetical protein